MDQEILASSIYVYNYLTNIYLLDHAEKPTDAAVCWGYDSIFEQVCVVNSANEEEPFSPVAKEITNRLARKKRIVTTLSGDSLPGWRLSKSKMVTYYAKHKITNNAKIVADPITDFKLISRDKLLKKAFISEKLSLLITQGFIKISLIRRTGSNASLGFAIVCPLKKMTILELVLTKSAAASKDVLHAITAALSNISLMNKPVIIIAGEDISDRLSENGSRRQATINYFERTGDMRQTVPPALKSGSAVLLSTDEYWQSVATLRSLGLPVHNDLPKNWDSLAALSQIINYSSVKKKSPVLDAGGEYYSVLLHHLALYGFTNLYCLNLAFAEQSKKNSISYIPGDITKTAFQDNFFGAIVCLSVMEHGVDPDLFFSEMNRILEPGGILFISVDYWENKIDAEGKYSYGMPIRIFSDTEIKEIIKIAAKQNFALSSPIDLRCEQRVVKCDGLKYTFLYLTFIKQMN